MTESDDNRPKENLAEAVLRLYGQDLLDADTESLGEKEWSDVAAFVEGRLSPPAALSFRERMLHDPRLQVAVADLVVALREPVEVDDSISEPIREGEKHDAFSLFEKIKKLIFPDTTPLRLAAYAVLCCLVLLGAFIAVRPDSTRREYRAAIASAKRGEMREASKRLEMLLPTLNPNTELAQQVTQTLVDWNLQLADSAAASSDFQRGMSRLDKLKGRIPPDARVIAKAADLRWQALLKEEGRPTALGSLEPLVATRDLAWEAPDHDEQIEQVMNSYQEATSITSDPAFRTEALAKRALIHLSRRDLEAARSVLDEARALGVASAILENVSGLYFHLAGNETAARKSFEASLKLDSSESNPAHDNLSLTNRSEK